MYQWFRDQSGLRVCDRDLITSPASWVTNGPAIAARQPQYPRFKFIGRNFWGEGAPQISLSPNVITKCNRGAAMFDPPEKVVKQLHTSHLGKRPITRPGERVLRTQRSPLSFWKDSNLQGLTGPVLTAALLSPRAPPHSHSLCRLIPFHALNRSWRSVRLNVTSGRKARSKLERARLRERSGQYPP